MIFLVQFYSAILTNTFVWVAHITCSTNYCGIWTFTSRNSSKASPTCLLWLSSHSFEQTFCTNSTFLLTKKKEEEKMWGPTSISYFFLLSLDEYYNNFLIKISSLAPMRNNLDSHVKRLDLVPGVKNTKFSFTTFWNRQEIVKYVVEELRI